MTAGIVLSTGIIIKVYRYGKYLDLDLAECSREELLEFYKRLDKEELIRLLVSLIKGSEIFGSSEASQGAKR
jgi:hypothetical protein